MSTAAAKPVADVDTPRERGSGVSAILVAAGILLSRMLGLFRQAFMARYLGARVAADAFNAAFKIPNMLQNLFGEGALSASFIPVYSRLLASEDEAEARRVAGAVGAILALVTAVLVLLGVLLAPALVWLIAAGFEGERRDLTIYITRILFPGAGIFVLGAWSQGILNSHRRFFLSYAAPVAWNLAMIGALVWYGPHVSQVGMAVRLAWASVIGAALQLLVQLPTVMRLVPGLRPRLDRSGQVGTVLRNFAPVAGSRGVVQLSAYIDQYLASFLPLGIVSMFSYATTLYTLPVSLFGMAISVAELPEMSRARGEAAEVNAFLRRRLDAGLARIAFFIVPSAVGFIALGDVIISALLRSGRFGATETLFTWGILAGSSVGLLAGTMGRLYSSTYYALHDTRTPLRFAMLRVLLTTLLGVLFALVLPRLLHVDRRWGGAGLTASAGMAAWVEFTLLRRRLNARIGHTGVPGRRVGTLWIAALVAAAAGLGLKLLLAGQNRFVVGALVIGGFALVYGLLTYALRVPEARGIGDRVLRRAGVAR